MVATKKTMIQSKKEFNQKHFISETDFKPALERLYLAEVLADLLIENNISKSDFEKMTKEEIIDILENNDYEQYDTKHIKNLIDISSIEFKKCTEIATKKNNFETITYPANWMGKCYRIDQTFNHFRTITIFEYQKIKA